MAIIGNWIDELVYSVNKHIELETSDGIRREGKLTGLQSKTIKFNEKDVEIITELQLNGDIYDLIPIVRINSFKIVE